MSKAIDLTGKRFDMLTVVKRLENAEGGITRWECLCDCGNKTIVRGGNLRSGVVKSCGCKRHLPAHNRTHQMSKTRIYRTWAGMIQRCTNPNHKSYKDYGEKGITVCNEWLDFENFRDWALQNGYSDNLTLERKNNDLSYCPENCCWITKGEQAKNKSDNLKIKYNNKTKTLAEWCRELGLNYKTTYMRICGYDWSIKDAFETPKNGRRKRGNDIGTYSK